MLFRRQDTRSVALCAPDIPFTNLVKHRDEASFIFQEKLINAGRHLTERIATDDALTISFLGVYYSGPPSCHKIMR
jgi:hypothetical protein